MLTGCASQEAARETPTLSAPPPGRSAPSALPQQQQARRSNAAGGTRQEAFLSRIRAAGEGTGVIRDARMRGDSELGVVLGQGVKLNEVKPVLVKLLKEMREEFPGRALTVRAYAPNNQPLATMRYDPSAPSSSNVTYTTNFSRSGG